MEITMIKTIKTYLRTFRLYIGKKLLDKRISPKQENCTHYQKILFLRQDGKIGDFIVSSFAFRELKKANPNCYIGIICTQKNQYLFAQNPFIDQCYIIKKKSILSYIHSGLLLRKQQYDVVIDPTILLRNKELLLLRLINAKNYLGYQKKQYGLFNLNLEGQYHFSALYTLALEQLGVKVTNHQYEIPFNEQSAQEIEIFLQQHQLRNYICLNFYGASKNRSFNDLNITHFLTHLTQYQDKQFVVLTHPAVTVKLKKLTESYSNIYLFENTQNIFHSIELIKHSDCLISPDTSVIHIATGLNKKVIGFYNQDEANFIQWHPNNPNCHILRFKESVNEIQPKDIKTEWLEK